MTSSLLPVDIFSYLSHKVLGQDDVLKQISVSVYKHIKGIKWSNIFLIGNSGTGKTTIMNSILEFYRDREELSTYQAMCVMNANTLVDDTGEVNIHRIFKNLEAGVRNRLGPVPFGDHYQGGAVGLQEVHVGIHTAGRRRPERSGRLALRFFGRAGIVDRMVLQVVRHGPAAVEQLLEPGMRYVARHYYPAVQRKPGADRMFR